METPRIRYATAKDCSQILEFIKQLAEYEKLAYEVTATVEDLEQTLFGKGSVAKVLICQNSKHTVGFALFFYNYSTFLGKKGIYLEDLFVAPEFRGNGYGFALFRELGVIAQKEGCGRIDWSVLKWNHTAIDFYLTLGAKPMEKWSAYRLEGDALNSLGKL